MWPESRLCGLLGLKYPIIQAPMAGSDTPALAAAVTYAGGMGSRGCAEMTPEAFHAAWAETRALTGGTLNVNFFAHAGPRHDEQKAARARALLAPFFTEFDLGEVPAEAETLFSFGEVMFAAVMEARPPVVSFHFGLPEAHCVEALKSAGTVILSTATTPSEARELEARGVDAIIAQGWDAGGHQGFFLTGRPAEIGTLALVPQVVDAVNVPVIAAGGIADGRGIAAALALGAAGVQIGTAFLTCAEANVAAPRRAAMLAVGGGDTRMSKAFTGRPARAIVNRYMAAMEAHEDDLPDFPLLDGLTLPLDVASAAAGSPDLMALLAGQAVGLNRETTATELFESLVAETRVAMARLAG
jgi:nitronate monooxygenase